MTQTNKIINVVIILAVFISCFFVIKEYYPKYMESERQVTIHKEAIKIERKNKYSFGMLEIYQKRMPGLKSEAAKNLAILIIIPIAIIGTGLIARNYLTKRN